MISQERAPAFIERSWRVPTDVDAIYTEKQKERKEKARDIKVAIYAKSSLSRFCSPLEGELYIRIKGVEERSLRWCVGVVRELFLVGPKLAIK